MKNIEKKYLKCIFLFFRLKDKRIVVYEFAAMAVLGDDNKFRIVVEGGLV